MLTWIDQGESQQNLSVVVFGAEIQTPELLNTKKNDSGPLGRKIGLNMSFVGDNSGVASKFNAQTFHVMGRVLEAGVRFQVDTRGFLSSP